MILFSIISIIFYYILCKELVYIDCGERIPFKMIHFILLAILACVPYFNIVVFALVIICTCMLTVNDCLGVKNKNGKIVKFLNKEV